LERIIAGKFDEYDFPYLEVEVLNKAKGLSQPAKAIIDTGAAHCMIREELALQLQLEVLREADYRHPVFGKFLLKEYLVDLCLEGRTVNRSAVLEGIRVGTITDPNYPASLIIGVEVLQYCRLIYDGPNKTFSLTLIKRPE
jgi:hypothetical protein